MKKFFFGSLALLSVASTSFAATTEGMKGLLPLGEQAPDFKLKDVVSGKEYSLADFSGKKTLVVAFICRHCPYVQHVKKALAQLGNDYKDKSAGIVAISANDPAANPDDSPEKLREMAIEEGFAFPLLFDETQQTAKAYTAVATPDIFIFDADRKLVYRGQFDDSRPNGETEATGKDVREAVEALLSGQPVSKDQKPAIGCSIKWKKAG
jgi:peroxiredoxin